MNLFMIDLNGAALESTIEEFQSKYKNIKIVAKKLDLTKLSDETFYEELDQELS